MIILGIDPGLATLGYGLIEVDKSELKYLKHGTIETAKNEDHVQRLSQIYDQLSKIIKKYQPEKVAVEELFFCKNTKTALKVGQAVGVVYLCLAQNKLRLESYTPLQVKQAISGYGNANKKQMQDMVKIILKLKSIPQPDDAADGLALALCCAQSLKFKSRIRE
ncbi:MAG: crossover junction endodeoxyribonuclease RuvC [Patescibacteria group bacterium]|jgi:crossover junction endodeoxyribonuclease RuvC|nr:crossover junction endodeoxyribonuclease RuvC [Patescibacteria group bacterium]